MKENWCALFIATQLNVTPEQAFKLFWRGKRKKSNKKKLTENEILEIIELNKSGKKYKDIAPMYGKSKNCINKIVNDYKRKTSIVQEA